MSQVKAKLVTIIAAYECEGAVRGALRQHGIKAFSVARTEGEGAHGEQRDGFAGNANYMFNVVTTTALASEILAWVERELIHKDEPAIAYVTDVEAVLK